MAVVSVDQSKQTVSFLMYYTKVEIYIQTYNRLGPSNIYVTASMECKVPRTIYVNIQRLEASNAIPTIEDYVTVSN